MPAIATADTLFAKTLALLRADKRRLSTIARESDLPYGWLYAVKRGTITEPGVDKVEKLAAYFSK